MSSLNELHKMPNHKLTTLHKISPSLKGTMSRIMGLNSYLVMVTTPTEHKKICEDNNGLHQHTVPIPKREWGKGKIWFCCFCIQFTRVLTGRSSAKSGVSGDFKLLLFNLKRINPLNTVT
jgi:hypothetical protein